MSNFEKQFTIKIPDEPFKTARNLGKTVTCTYSGPRFIVVELNPYTGECMSPVGFYIDHTQINLNQYYRGDECKIILVDADKNPFEASYITHHYTNEEIDDYVFKINGEEVWRYGYEKQTGIFSDIFKPLALVYDFTKEQFLPVPFAEHGITKEEFWKGIEGIIKEYESRKENSKECKEYLSYLKNLKSKYNNIDHWKIPFKIRDPYQPIVEDPAEEEQESSPDPDQD